MDREIIDLSEDKSILKYSGVVIGGPNAGSIVRSPLREITIKTVKESKGEPNIEYRFYEHIRFYGVNMFIECGWEKNEISEELVKGYRPEAGIIRKAEES